MSRPGEQAVSTVDPRAFTPDELRAGWRLACRAQAEADLVVEVPPLQTRPKAALAGVGRHVILRPAVQKRYLELTEPTLEDQVSDLERVLQAMDDVELRVPMELLRSLGATLRTADWKVTAVLVDDLLVDVEAGDTSARRHAIAYDLGTTTVVATLHRSRDRAACRGQLDVECAAAVRRRRDHADQRNDDGPGRTRHAA